MNLNIITEELLIYAGETTPMFFDKRNVVEKTIIAKVLAPVLVISLCLLLFACSLLVLLTKQTLRR